MGVPPVNGAKLTDALSGGEKMASGISPPASAIGVPIDTARMQVNQATFTTSMMMPSGDGLYAIGSVAVKIVNDMGKFVSSVKSNWGF